MKFSVIIPTMWQSGYIYLLLDRLINCDFVGEVLIIDNNPFGYKPTHEKVKTFTKGYNIYVNPAWNVGVELARFDNICLCNDDIYFNTEVFEFLSNQMGQGVYGLSTNNYYLKEDTIFLTSPIDVRPWGWGCAIFFKKKHFKKIPADLLIACGDDYLIKNMSPFKIDGLKICGEVSKTSLNSTYLPIQENDLKIFKEKYND